MADLELVYVGDPMCSWCWGFAPSLEALRARFDLPLRVVVGGLRPGEAAEPMTDAMAATLAHHWEQVAEASGQPFDHAPLARRGWRYDTEPAAVAFVAVREVWPDLAIPWFFRLQQAFYAENVDLTDTGVYQALASELLPNPLHFLVTFGDVETRRAAWRDFQWASQMGVRGFPTLLLRDGERWGALCRGYLPPEALVQGFEGWLRERLGDEAEAFIRG